MTALIDADIVVHRVAHTTKYDPEGIARYRFDEMVERIIDETSSDEFQLWISDLRENNFRTHLYPFYKANRTQPRPRHYDYLKEYAIREWGARIAYGMEADDALGIAQDKETFTSVICSIDKDLHQIPGNHYNFVKQEAIIVSQEQARTKFYSQILTGDPTDNIRGCRQIGPVKAAKILAGLGEGASDATTIQAILQTYQKQHDDMSTEEIIEHITLVARLLKIKQEEGEQLWNFPNLETDTAG